MIPSPDGDTQKGDVSLADYADWLDGAGPRGRLRRLPTSYGETPIEPKWSGDRIRDDYESALLAAFAERGKPVLGICRGLQIMNVAFGGTLLQDIATQRAGPRAPPQREIYDRNLHTVEFVPGHAARRALRRHALARPSTASTTRASRTWRPASWSRRAARPTG